MSGSLSKTTAPEQSEMIARECYQNLIPNANWQNNLQGKGQILEDVSLNCAKRILEN